MDERFRDALRRNALLSEVLAEGYQPSADAALRSRLRHELARARRRRAGALVAAVAAAALLVFVPRSPAPVPPPPAAAAPVPSMEIVSTEAADPRIEIVRTDASFAVEVVRTQVAFDLARDEDLLTSPRVLAIVGHPGAPRRLIVAP